MSVNNKNIVITSAARTPIGTFRGSLKEKPDLFNVLIDPLQFPI